MAKAEKPRSSGQDSPHPLRGGPGAFMMRPKERAKNQRDTMLRLWKYLGGEKWPLALVLLLVAAASGLGLLGPYLFGLSIDKFIAMNDLPGLAWLCVLMFTVYAGSSAIGYVHAWLMAGISQRIIRMIRTDLFTRLQSLPLRYFDQRSHGELMSRLANDVENVNNVLAEGATQLFASALGIIGVSIAMFLINHRLAIVSLMILPVMALITKWVAGNTRRGFKEQQEQLGALNGLIEETITGQRVVKAYCREPHVIAEFDGTNEKLCKAAIRAQIFAGLLGPMSNFVNNTGFAAIAASGGWMAVKGLVTVGAIASFISYARQFTMPLNQIANLYNAIQAALAGAERVFEVIDETAEIVDDPDALPLQSIQGEIHFDDVCFGYDKDVPVLKNVALHAKRGAMIALIGPTGAGKTTIVNLLTRFYDIDSGAISLDGSDIRKIRKDELRRALGIVLQDTFLFAGPVMENIRYGRLDAADEEVIAAAVTANADQFIHRLPQGYQTPLSERGGNISQGQRQLLAIARAILANPSVLILDEATSSVDTRTEKHIQEAMLRLMAGRTSFVIAHRLSTIREADEILVINHGEIIERGAHQALLDAKGFYYNLYISQFKGQHALE
ncbi:ABC transporter ATP-binding protein [Candidatus Sumerlaeota bacterium]|nr:ABC transporter ATP-binding protein [Candidatus Sumerlaeota bacterium]